MLELVESGCHVESQARAPCQIAVTRGLAMNATPCGYFARPARP
ncbi:hypothetical protein BRPE64_ACDS08950 [Caballeronia insecticola]|uniref:Uncharacterized protein n=1 Tax=Caballeronia insecticola TaxID=758793 RepID=R4WG33_9BURK|nr:hypothetical protein BRPE64_ACDS08950 [Caballeronia insecticola]